MECGCCIGPIMVDGDKDFMLDMKKIWKLNINTLERTKTV